MLEEIYEDVSRNIIKVATYMKCITYNKGCYDAETFRYIRKCKVIGIETSPYNELCVAVVLKGNDLPK